MAQRSVHRDGFVEVERSYYSAPPERIGSQVWVKWDSREVRLLDDTFTQLVIHRRLKPGKFSESLVIGGASKAPSLRLEENWEQDAGATLVTRALELHSCRALSPPRAAKN